ncbi:MAG: hypothetical protein AAF292_13240 [Pseudomonadota bacterium]
MRHRLIAILILASAPLTARFLTAQANSEGPAPDAAILASLPADGDFVACDEIIVSDAAFDLAKAAVAEKLWSPASAEFPLAASRVSELEACRYIIRSWVDAKNGFGQMVRTPYVVELENTTGDWSVLGARLGSPIYSDRLQLAAAGH